MSQDEEVGSDYQDGGLKFFQDGYRRLVDYSDTSYGVEAKGGILASGGNKVEGIQLNQTSFSSSKSGNPNPKSSIPSNPIFVPTSLCAGLTHELHASYSRVIECQQSTSNLEATEILEDVDCEVEEVDLFIGRMGLIVSNGDGNEVKLSKYLKMSEDRGKSYRTDRGNRELKKLEWDMKDAFVGVHKRKSRVGPTNSNR